MPNKISLVLLGASRSIHLQRWANSLANKDLKVSVISMDNNPQAFDSRISFYTLPIKGFLGYFLNTFFLKQLLKKIQPDLLNTHYASGYGTLARFSDFKLTLLSVWGSDVFAVPDKGKLHKKVITKNLLSAYYIAATSNIMARRVNYLTNNSKQVRVTPFGIDTNIFKPLHTNKNEIVIGTIKTLLPRYGIDELITSFAELKKQLDTSLPNLSQLLRLKIIGTGQEEKSLKKLSSNLGIDDIVEFIGEIAHSDVPEWLNKLDIYVALSREESFGVAILEASSCELPVVVSDVGGLPEVVNDKETGFIVPSMNTKETVIALTQLVRNKDLRLKMGKAGRKWVLNNYSWTHSVNTMINLYKQILK